jgi:hypothetical protein
MTQNPAKTTQNTGSLAFAAARLCDALRAQRRAFVLAAGAVPERRNTPATGRVGRGPASPNTASLAELATRRRKSLGDRSVGIAALAVLLAVVLVLLTPIGGCSATTKAAGPAADATHETRVERPGEERTRRIEVRVKQGSDQRDSEGSDEGAEGALECPAPETSEGAAELGGVGRSAASARLAAFVAAAVIGQPSGSEIRATQTGTDELLRAAAELARQGLEIEIVIDEYEHRDTSADTTRSTFAERPATLATSSAEAALGFDTRLRRFALPWGGEAEGGGLGIEATVLGGRGVNVLHLVGAAVMCMALIPLLRTPRRWSAAAVFGGVGLGIVMTGTLVDEYPWVTLLAAALLLALLAYGAYEAWRRGRLVASLDAITPVVEKSEFADELKTQIGEKAGRLRNAVKAETTASKARQR